MTKENVLSAIFYQDAKMKEIYSYFPEIIFIDATHKLNELRMSLYVLLVEDGNGESEVVAIWIVVNEDASSIKKMVNLFKLHNKNWHKTTTIMSDKDFVEREVFKEEFPDAHLHICLFHVLRTFRREITSGKLGITQSERTLVLELLQKMAYATGEDQYLQFYDQLKGTNIKSVLEYFDTNWHCIRQQWVNGLKNDDISFMNRTNNRVESINQKIKSVMSKHSSINQFCSELLKVLSTLRVERDHKVICFFRKVPAAIYSVDSAEQKYMDLLMPYALNYVLKQIELASKVKLLDRNGTTIVESSEGPLCVTAEDCQCSFWKTMQLPCRHILAFRTQHSSSLYSSSLCAVWWTQMYYKSSHKVFDCSVDADTPLECNISTLDKPSTRNVLSQHEKYRKAYQVSQKLASLASESAMREYQQRLKTLEDVVHIWETGGRCNVQECDEGNGNCYNYSIVIHCVEEFLCKL